MKGHYRVKENKKTTQCTRENICKSHMICDNDQASQMYKEVLQVNNRDRQPN